MKISDILKIKITSRRERMTYWLMVIWVYALTFSVFMHVPLLEVSGFFAVLLTGVAWYLDKESKKPSKEPM
jgi:hypothetical protein